MAFQRMTAAVLAGFCLVAICLPAAAAPTPTPSPTPSASPSASPSSSASPSAAPGHAGPGNSITDVPGIAVGSYQRTDGTFLTGSTVVHAVHGAVGGVDQRGGAPGTRETDLLSPLNSNSQVNAVLLTGGSAYGLDAAGGVMSWLEQHHEGTAVGPAPQQVVPIVPGAVIFDLGRGGDFAARPTADFGTRAVTASSTGPVVSGNVGGGTGARAGGIKGGLGTASVKLDNGDMVGAVVVVNAAGSTVDPADCSLFGVKEGLPGEFADLHTPTAAECKASGAGGQSLNTTIAVVATSAPLDKAAAARMAGAGQDGLARAVRPAHTLVDGDTVFGLATGAGDKLTPSDPTATDRLDNIYAAAAEALTRAIAHAMIAATSAKSIVSYCDTYPSACTDVPATRYGRGAGPITGTAPSASASPSTPTSPGAEPPPAATQPPAATVSSNRAVAWTSIGIAGVGLLIGLLVLITRLSPRRGRL